MKYTEARRGRMFILRLEDGDRIPAVIEDFANREQVEAAVVFFLGGSDEGSRVVVGPEYNKNHDPIPRITELPRISESVGLGTIFPDEENYPRLHLHSAFGQREETITGCTREGVSIWQIGEVVVMELVDSGAVRRVDEETGFELLEI